MRITRRQLRRLIMEHFDQDGVRPSVADKLVNLIVAGDGDMARELLISMGVTDSDTASLQLIIDKLLDRYNDIQTRNPAHMSEPFLPDPDKYPDKHTDEYIKAKADRFEAVYKAYGKENKTFHEGVGNLIQFIYLGPASWSSSTSSRAASPEINRARFLWTIQKRWGIREDLGEYNVKRFLNELKVWLLKKLQDAIGSTDENN